MFKDRTTWNNDNDLFWGERIPGEELKRREVTFRAADQLAVFALDHATAVPVFPFDFRPNRRHIRPILLLGCIDHDYPAFAVADAPPGDLLRLDAKITDDLIGYYHRDLELL